MVNNALAVVALLLVLPVLAAAGCGNTATEPEAEIVPITIISQKMSVHEFSGDVKQSIAVVSGTARNDGEMTVASPFIEAVFYDKNGDQLGTASASTSNLAPGTTWNFTLQFQGPDSWKTVTYTLSVSTGMTP